MKSLFNHDMKSPLIIVTVMLLFGCAPVQYAVVGKFDDFNETMRGNISSGYDGTAQLTGVMEQSKASCSGHSVVTFRPLLGCVGLKGTALLSCTDGRKFNIDWVRDSCTTGYGRGRDQNGVSVTMVFGSDDAESELKLAKLRQEASANPALPAYRPIEVRKEKGFSTGTGFFVTNDGVIITNHHVIEDSKRIVVVRPGDKTEYEAVVLQVDPANDVAILKIQATSIAIPIASSSDAVKGQEIMALGYPLIAIQGQEQKATFGRINSLTGLKDDVRLLQIDVPIQPGNSGSPLLSKRGEVIGVVTSTLNSIVTLRTAGSLPQSVNFAVKSDYIIPTLRSALKNSYSISPGYAVDQPIEKVVASREPSVVLVIAR